jgi:dipeptidyl aminopeptidase/acylaminoacyl peptidase
MIVSVYMAQSQTRYFHYVPEPASSAQIQSPLFWLSKGYLVFKPDILNTEPHPLTATVASVVSGVQMLIDNGFVDASRIALVGHSWGGYEVNYLLTQTDLFRCAVESAGIANTISDYGSLMEGGIAREQMYEHGGSHFHGGPLWGNPLNYVQSSPVFFAPSVRAPLLILHNEGDDTVPFSQAVEWYLALRRNEKEAWLINYGQEGHELAGYANQLDWERRMQEFLDHFLRGSPRPQWMQANSGRSPP